MNHNNIIYWLPIEESRDCTTFEGSLQSKMSIKKFILAILDILNAKKSMVFFNLMKVASAVRKEEIIKRMDKVKRHNERESDFIR